MTTVLSKHCFYTWIKLRTRGFVAGYDVFFS